MTKALFKKQMMEVFSWVFKERKTGKLRTRSGAIVCGLLYLLLFAFVGLIFLFLAMAVSQLITTDGVQWLYWGIMGSVAVFLGVFGSVFNTYSSLYQAKDNDLLLSMPIPVHSIMIARLSGVYAMGLLYELIVIIPALIVWFIHTRFTLLGTIFTLLIPFVLSFFVLVLSCILGWVVALIARRLKSKNFITVIVSLVFLGAYYYFYSRAYDMLGAFLAAASDPVFSGRAKIILYPLYHMGKAAQGSFLSFLIFTAIIAALSALTVLVISKSFIKLATANSGSVRVKAKRTENAKVSSVKYALFKKELCRFKGSAGYMLNCGMGLLFLLAAAVAVLWKESVIREFVPSVVSTDLAVGIASVIIALIIGSGCITAPSVSLEGKSLWLLRSLPVSGKQVLTAKLMLQVVLTAVPAIIAVAAVLIVVRPSVAVAVLMLIYVMIYVVLTAAMGLCFGVSKANFCWTSEMIPIKQSSSVILTILIGWALALVFGVVGYLLSEIVGFSGAMAVICLLSGGLCFALIRNLLTKGAEKFDSFVA